MGEIQSMAPWIGDGCETLILGSIPGVISLKQQTYYAHPRNAFWPIMQALFAQDGLSGSELVLAQKIGLWDVIGSCYREGSLDSAISQEEANDFSLLYTHYPTIRRVFFNGRKAFATYKRQVGFDDVRTFSVLPSTSPAHTISFEKKLAAWQSILG